MKGEWVWQNPGADASGIQRAAVDWMIERLSQVRKRTNMYISELAPEIMRNWFNGFANAMSFLGINDHDCREEVLNRRGVRVTSTILLEAQFSNRGWSPEKIVDEMLAIEIDVRQAQRKSMEFDPFDMLESPPPPPGV
jgi:hypothetical protein